MANVLVQESSLQDIADAIRSKNGTQNTYKPAQMAEAIEAISGGGITPTGTINITANGTVDVTNYASANVNVPTGTTPTGTKQISITQNGTITEDVTNYASAEIAVNVPSSGGGVDSGTVTGDGTKTISIPTSKQYSNVVVWCLSADVPTESSWQCLGVMGVAGEHHDCSIYNNSNTVFARNQPTITFSANAISVSNLKYNTFNGATYHWYAW